MDTNQLNSNKTDIMSDVKIYMMQGPPACGKSTKAKELYEEDKIHRVIVSRDMIRDSRGDYWVPEQEDYISKLEENAIREAIQSGLSPIIDATNLNPKTIQKWSDIANEYKVNLISIECIVPYKEACERDLKRDRPVGKKVLRSFYNRYYPNMICPMSDDRHMKEFNESKPKAIIVDIDGTIALRRNRSPFDYEKCMDDAVDFRLAHLLKNLICETEYKVFFVTGREDIGNCKQLTKEWLDKHIYPEIYFNGGFPKSNWVLKMRSTGDHRPDDEVKKEIYKQQIEPWNDVVIVFDDRNKVVKMWRDLGLLCAQVYDGDF